MMFRPLQLFSAAALAVVLAAAPARAQQPKVHQLPATPATVAYGYYWSEAKPAVRVASGDIVEIETMLTNSPTGLERMGVKPEDVPQHLRDIVTQVTGTARGPGGHILTGPIYVEGADSGDVLEVRIQRIDLPLAYGDNGCAGFIRELCGQGASRLIMMDRKAMTAEVAPGVTVPLRPFWGSIGVAPAAALGRVSSNPPGPHAGNMDNKELVAGTTLFVPVFVKGALLELGDGHAAQGDGELTGDALETSMDVEFSVEVDHEMQMSTPRAESGEYLMSIGIAGDLQEALRQATTDLTRWLSTTYKLNSAEVASVLGTAMKYDVADMVGTQVSIVAKVPRALVAKLAASK